MYSDFLYIIHKTVTILLILKDNFTSLKNFNRTKYDGGTIPARSLPWLAKLVQAIAAPTKEKA